MFPLLQQLQKTEGIDLAYPFGEYHHIVLKNESITINQLQSQIRDIQELEIKSATPDIEDCFIYAMKNN